MNPLRRAPAMIAEPRETKRYTTAELLPAFQDNRPRFKEWSTDTAIKDRFKASVWVCACVHRIMKDAASVPWLAETKKGDEWQPAPESPLTQLMENPNPFMSRQDMIERLTAHLYLGGNALWSKVMVRKIVAELWPIDPSGVRPVPSRTKFITKYKYDRDGVVNTWEVSQIIQRLEL